MKTSTLTMLRVAIGALLTLASISIIQAAEPRSPAPAATQLEDTVFADTPESGKAERLVAKSPDDRKARLAAARAQLAEGAETSSRVEMAQQHAKAVLQENPNDVEALLLAGQTSLLMNDAMSAARYYRAATVVDARSATAFLGLGDALSRLGDELGSTAAFAKYRELTGMPPLQTSGPAK